MRRTTTATAAGVLPVLVAGLCLLPASPSAAAAGASGTAQQAADGTSYGDSHVVAGGGRGWSGPASRADIGPTRPDAASDGTLLMSSAEGASLLRVDPTTDRMQVLTGTGASDPGSPLDAVDVAADGVDAVVATATSVIRVSPAGARTPVAALAGVRALDVGADGVVWLATARQVLRVLRDGTVVAATPATQFGSLTDLTVTPDGTRAYVLESGPNLWAVYPVTSGGVGARVAGTLTRSDSLVGGQLATSASTESVSSITTDGQTVTMSSPEYQRVVRFPVGGVLTEVLGGRGAQSVTVLGADLAVGISEAGAPAWHLDRVTTTGVVTGRLAGVDPARRWSPDGVAATDAYLGTVRGGAGLPGGPTVFTTAEGLVREVGADARLRTRAALAPLTARGKVALGPDGTAYVVTDAGGVVRVPASGASSTVPLDADVTDVEVRADGTLLAADRRGGRVLQVPPGGAASVLATGLVGVSDLGLDGDAVLVADTGIRRVGPGGAVTTVLTGGAPRSVTAVTEGVLTATDDPLLSGLAVVVASGAILPVRADFGPAVQVQAVGGDALLAGQETIRLVADPGLPPEPDLLSVTATPGSGRIILDWNDWPAESVDIRARRGTVPPADRWDGEVVGPSHTVLHIGGEVVQPGDVWSFAVFPRGQAPAGPNLVVNTIGARGTATAAALEDTTPPPGPVDPQAWATRTRTGVTYRDPTGDDYSHSVVQFLPGTAAPQTPQEGTRILDSRDGTSPGFAEVPTPVKGQDYAVSVFVVDLHGNTTRWSTVTRLDWQPPAQVADVVVTPAYTAATVTLTPPADADYTGLTYAVAPGTAVPALPDAPPLTGLPLVVPGLTMDTDYTLAVWSHDVNGNVSEPVLTRFRTLLDAVPPQPVSGLTAVGGDYRVDAAWTPPTDADLKNLQVTLVDVTKGTSTTTTVAKTATTAAWPRQPGGHDFEVRVTATDVNGNVSDVRTATATTSPDANGAPAAIDPATVTVTPVTSTTVAIAFPRPSITDLRSLGYAVIPLGANPDSVTTMTSLPTTSATVKATISLPQPVTGYQLVLDVWDFNSNRARSVVPEVKGAYSDAEKPGAPTGVTASTPYDNAIDVAWTTGTYAVPAAEWVVTATSDTLTRTTVVPGTARSAALRDVVGRRGWTVSVVGRNVAGTGVAKYAPLAVTVGDTTAPAPASSLKATPSYDTLLLSWVNPTAFDFDHVVVTRYGATTAETKVLYSGKAMSVRDTGLAAGRSYTFLVRAYDALGNTAVVPARLDRLQASATMSVATSVRYPGSVKATGTLLWNGAPLAGRTISVQAQRVGSTTWSTAASIVTSSTGTYAVTVRPGVSTRYRIVFAGGGTAGGFYAAGRTVTVTPSVTVRASRTSLLLGGTATLSTTVGPTHAGRSISLQWWSGTAWTTVTRRTLSSTSTASAVVKPPRRGTNSYRWVLPSHTDHGTGVSATMRLSVS